MVHSDDRSAGAAPEDTLQRFGRYRVERLIGSGPMGAVFLGRDPILGRPVAIKRVALRVGRLPVDTASRLDELEKAFGSLGSLAHPHIVTIHDAGVQDDQAFLVSEYVPGSSLASLISSAPLETYQVTALAAQIATALDFAHGRDVAHGNLKPSNVLVARNGPAKLADFGVAIALAHSRLGHKEWLTAAPWHLAPELITEGRADAKSDQWSLAVLLFQMLTGKLPFDAAGIDETLEAITERRPLLPTLARPSLSTEVDLVLLRSLDRDPEARHPTCGDLARRLARALDLPTVPAIRAFTTQPLDDELRQLLERTQPVSSRPLPSAAGGGREAADAAPDRAPDPVVDGMPSGPARAHRPQRFLPWLAGLVVVLSIVGFATRSSWLGSRVAISPASFGANPWEGDEATTASPPVVSARAQPPAPTSAAAPPPAAGRTSRLEGSPAAPPASSIRVPDDAAARPETATLRIELISELASGIVTVWVGDEKVLGERFQFGGPMRFLRGNRLGGHLEAVREVPSGHHPVRVHTVLPGPEIEEVPLAGAFDRDREATLEIRVFRNRRVEARLY